ncbi:hypothetical protein HNY73_003440 [Argiope bruennichi]|uniref:Uncharacterized protein n=1 Tax=Argiope bruennichi TaxID=94029 RepID=A0A8T0FKK7_ARGBR|nr:hypothetical protein HNY73_003440 [Argiope bruennichi]
MKAISKEMRKRQKHFPWLKTFIKEFLKTYPNCKKTLQYLVENIEKEIKELRTGLKQKTEALFETVNDMYLHFWWKIHWRKSSQWKNYWCQGTTHSNHDSEMLKCFGNLLKSLIYLGIILSQRASNSVWINRVLQAINILPVNDEIVYDALLQLHYLKKKYRNSYTEILRHILCSQIILNFSEPAIYIKSLLLFRRLKNSLDDEVAKASLISTASKIKPPSNLVPWLASLEIYVDANKNIVDELFKKNSKQVFQKLYHVLIDSGKDVNSVSLNNVENLKSKKKCQNEEFGREKEEKSLLRMVVDSPDSLNKNVNSNIQPFENMNMNEKDKQFKRILLLPDLYSQNISTKNRKPKKKKKSKVKNDAVDTNKAKKNTGVKSKDASKNSKSSNKSKKSQKKKKCKKRNNSGSVIPDNKKNHSCNMETHSNEINSSCIDDSVSVKLSSSGTENQLSETDKVKYTVCRENSEDKISNKIELSCKLPNLLMNYEICTSAEENEMKRREASSCPQEETGEDVLVPDTCQNDVNSIVPFNLDSWIPSKDDTSRDTSISNDGSLVSDKYLYASITEAKMHQNNQSDYSNSPINDSSLEYINDSEVSRDTFVSNDGSQISDKYPYVSLIDIRKNKKLSLCLKSDDSNSSSDYSITGNINDSEISQDTCISNDGSQISNKIPYVSLIDIRKTKNLSSYQKSDCSNSSFDNSFIESINSNEMSEDIFISKEESQISNKDPKGIEEVDVITHHHIDSNYDHDLESVKNGVFNENSNNTLYNDLCITENKKDESQNIQIGSHHEANGNKDSELPSDETIIQTKEFRKSQLPLNKHSKARTPSVQQDMININLNTKQNSPTKRKRKETSCNVKKQQKKKYSSDGNKNLVSSKEVDCHQDLETSTKDVSGDTYLNDLSTLLVNHDVIETQENDAISPSTDIDLHHSDKQDLSQFKKHNTSHEKSNILPNKLNEKMPSHTSLANVEEHPCITLSNENHQNDVPACSIETVINEFLESELSKVHTDNLNSVSLTNHVTGKALAENVHSAFQTQSDCFSYKSNGNTPKNDNERNMLSVSSSLTTGNRSIENEVAQSLLSLSVNENSERIALSTNPGHRNKNSNVINSNLNSGNSSFVVDCNIINDFDSRNSSRAGSSVSGDATTIKVVLNLINAKQENCSNLNCQNPNSSGNGFFPACNFSQSLPSSIASVQVMNNSSSSVPICTNNDYFTEPPFFLRRTTNELDTPPDSESHLSMQRLPRAKNMVPSCSEDKTNFILSKSKGRSSTPKNLSRKRQYNEFPHSSESANEWQVNQCDLNSSFSNIPTVQTEYCENVLSSWNGHQKGNIYSAKGNQNKELISRFGDHSAPIGGNNVLQTHSQASLYRNSRPSIYSDESEDELSVGTMSLLSGEETDHSLLKAVDAISPKTPLRKKNKNKTKKLFREEKWALDTLNAESSVDEKSMILKEPTPQKKKRQKKIVRNAKKPKATMNHDYNLRSRKLLIPPTKLKSYIT